MSTYEQLKQDGIANGMCQKMQDEWTNPNVPELCRMFFRGMDFCIEHDWPSLETIKSTFDPEDAAYNGIYFEDGTSEGQTNVCALGDAEVHVHVPPFKVCDIYARHHSKVHIHLGVGAFCYVSILDFATVQVEEKQGGARLNASYFSGEITNPEMFDKIHDKNADKR